MTMRPLLYILLAGYFPKEHNWRYDQIPEIDNEQFDPTIQISDQLAKSSRVLQAKGRENHDLLCPTSKLQLITQSEFKTMQSSFCKEKTTANVQSMA